MSSTAAWSYVHEATLWRLTSREEWGGQQHYASPVVFKCDFIIEARTARSAQGDEFVTRARFFTERAGIAFGDRVLPGRSTVADPLAAGADEVRAVIRYPDTLGRGLDDFELLTG